MNLEKFKIHMYDLRFTFTKNERMPKFKYTQIVFEIYIYQKRTHAKIHKSTNLLTKPNIYKNDYPQIAPKFCITINDMII